MKRILLFLVTLGLAGATPAWGSSDTLPHDTSNIPKGVVFEVVTSDPHAWERLLPGLQQEIREWRSKYPEIPVVVVSHGREQFSLTKDNARRFESVQARIHALVGKENVKVQVCGRNAKLHGVDAAQFPSDIEVVERGPLAVQDYVARGYRHIVRD